LGDFGCALRGLGFEVGDDVSEVTVLDKVRVRKEQRIQATQNTTQTPQDLLLWQQLNVLAPGKVVRNPFRWTPQMWREWFEKMPHDQVETLRENLPLIQEDWSKFNPQKTQCGQSLE
jgi:hypothetical protein